MINGLDPICAFPARVNFFRDVYGFSIDNSHCKGISYWKTTFRNSSLSLVYTTSYSGNPASFFGHTFIKISPKENKKSDLLSYAFSFTAANTESSGLKYMYNGIFGGYKGIFQLEPFYAHVMKYGYIENRDLWTYPLDFTKKEVELFVEHFWELYSNAYVDYYFFDDNCTGILFELLNVSRPELNLLTKKDLMITPKNLLESIEPIIKENQIDHFSSQEKQFSQKIANYSEEELEVYKSIERDFTKVYEISNIKILDALIDKINIQKSNSSLDNQIKLREKENILLAHRASLGQFSGIKNSNKTYQYTSPHLGHTQRKISVSLGRDSVMYNLKYGLHDLLDPPFGFEPYYHMNYLNLNYLKENSFTKIDGTIVDIMSLEPVTSLKKPLSWSVKGGLVYTNYKSSIATSWYFTGSYGKSYKVFSSSDLFFILPEISISANSKNKFLMEPGIKFGYFKSFDRSFRALLTIKPYISYEISRRSTINQKLVSELKNQYSINKSLVAENSLIYREADIEAVYFGLGKFF